MLKSAIKNRRRWPKVLLWTVLSVLAVAIGVLVAGWIWYTQQVNAVVKEDAPLVRVVIEPGSTPEIIADQLRDEGVINSSLAFLLHTRFNGVQGKLQAGAYRLSPSETIPEIADHLVKGNVDTFSILFYPGAVLVDYSQKPLEDRQDVTGSLLRAGYTEEEIKAGLMADFSEYNDTLFQGRPEGADLEGYVYGDTYKLSSGASVEDALRASFNEFWRVIQENDLIAKYEAKGMSLFEGITLASIIQKEAVGGDEAQISQVFHSRLEAGMQLGSDPTYQYIADKTGVPRDLNLDSPYNTRRFTGLTPGPIATAGLASLKAVAEPAGTDYLYFLSGDDNKTYFSRTFSEHESNIANHCKIKCLAL